MTRRAESTIGGVALSLAALLGAAVIVEACGAFTADTPAANADGGSTDGGSGTGSETGAGEAGTTGFCAMHADAVVCSDFDGTNELGGWNLDVTPDAGTLQTNSTTFRSAPRSLRTAIAGKTLADARLTRPIPRSAKRVRVSFEIRLGQGALKTGQEISIAEIYCGGQGVDEGAYVFVEEPSFDVNAHTGDNAAATTKLSPLRTADWTAIELDAHLDVSPYVTVTVNGVRSAHLDLAAACPTRPVLDVRLGLSTYTFAVSEAFYDNVLVELDPTGP